MIMLRANVVFVANGGVFVTVPAYGGSEFGPMEVLADGSGTTPTYAKGDRVVVGQIGKVKEDLVIMGHLRKAE